MNKVTYNQYQKIIRRKAWERFKREHPIFDLVVPLIIALAIGLEESIRITGKVEPVITAFVTAVGTAVIYFILYIWYFSREQVAVYNTDQQQIEAQDKIINPKVDLELYRFTPDAHADGEKWVGLYIHNSSGICAIKKCKVSLLDFNPPVRGTSNLPAEMMWSANNKPDDNGFMEIPRNGQKTLDVAWAFPNQNYSLGAMTLARSSNMISFSSGRYEIEFRIDGEINDNPIPAQIYSAEIILEEGKDIRIEKILKRRSKKVLSKGES